eukprot:279657-Rhodomonas_salina.1
MQLFALPDAAVCSVCLSVALSSQRTDTTHGLEGCPPFYLGKGSCCFAVCRCCCSSSPLAVLSVLISAAARSVCSVSRVVKLESSSSFVPMMMMEFTASCTH